MTSVLLSLLLTLRGLVRSRLVLHLEVLPCVINCTCFNGHAHDGCGSMTADRWLWAWLSTSWPAWRTTLVIVKPETVLA